MSTWKSLSLNQEKNSEFISGQKESFPLDKYILNLYTVFLSPVRERYHAAVVDDITFKTPGLYLIDRIDAENIETPVDIKSSIPIVDTEPVVYYTGFKFGTTGVVAFSSALFFWPFYVIIVVAVLISLSFETQKVALSMHIILASFILLLTQHVQFMEIVPSEIWRSFAHAITLSSSFMLMFSFIFASLVLCAGRHRQEHESLWEHLGSRSKLGIGVVLLILFIGTPVYVLGHLLSMNFLDLKFWGAFFLIPWLAIFIFMWAKWSLAKDR